MRGRIGSALRWAALALGLGLMVLVLRRVGTGALRAALGRAGPRFLWTVAAYGAATAVGALPWGLLMPRRERPSWRAVITSRFAASGVNAVLPFMSVGDVGRLLWLQRPAWASGTAAMVVDRLLFLLAGAVLLAAGVASSRSLTTALPASFGVVGAAVAAGIVAAVAVAGLALARGRLGGRLARFFKRRAPDGAGAIAAEPWDAIAGRLLTRSRRRLVGSLALHALSRALFVLEIYAGLRILGLPSGWRETTIFAAVPVALSVVGTVVPGQVGVQEAAQALIASALGIGPSAGLALALLQRARQLLFVPLSGLLVALRPGRARANDP